MKLILMIPSLTAGGAERVMTLLASAFVARGHDVTLLTLGDSQSDFFAVDARVRRVALGVNGYTTSTLHALRANIQRVRALRRVVRERAPDAVLSFMTSMNVLAILACLGSNTRVVVSERIDPQSHRPEKLWEILRALTYSRTDVLVAQTKQAADWFRNRLPRTQVVTIPNPVVPSDGSAVAESLVAGPYILAAGRLVPQKGFDVLLRAFERVAREHPDLRLVIAGEGPEGPALKEQAARLDLAARVLFPGAVRSLPALMRNAVAFVLASRYEGFPNVVLEALANAAPVVATDCPGGPREILADGKHGLLVPTEDAAALGDALNRVAGDPQLRSRLSMAGEAALQNYRLDRVASTWERLLQPT
jgi:glycosyltransferase involved in cell wall biosynthesis